MMRQLIDESAAKTASPAPAQAPAAAATAKNKVDKK
jgi:hypothetical protein